jgi:hypothetical protein
MGNAQQSMSFPPQGGMPGMQGNFGGGLSGSGSGLTSAHGNQPFAQQGYGFAPQQPVAQNSGWGGPGAVPTGSANAYYPGAFGGAPPPQPQSRWQSGVSDQQSWNDHSMSGGGGGGGYDHMGQQQRQPYRPPGARSRGGGHGGRGGGHGGRGGSRYQDQ